MEYEHNGVKIQFDQQRATFIAVVKDNRITAPSLDAIKSKIVAAQKIKFEPFKALIIEGYGQRSLQPVTVVGVKKSMHRGSDKFYFVTSIGRTVSSVAEDTPANRRAFKEWRESVDRAEKSRKAMEEISEEAEGKIKHLEAADYAPTEK